MEARWPLEAAAFCAVRPMLRAVGRGDEHPVLVLPGFTADDVSTGPLRWTLRAHGYWVHGWRLGRNLGPTARTVDGMRTRIDELYEHHGRRVTLLGWSLGGVYARLLARERADHVRQVITLGSPYRMEPGDRSTVQGLWDRMAPLHDGELAFRDVAEGARPRLTVPATSIYSRSDGVVPWQLCIDEVGPIAENIEVRGSHIGLGVSAAVLVAVLDRLAQRETAWRPFRAPLGIRHWYPPAATWDVSRRATSTGSGR
jgi:pimeloyl-ACP methyl ester carboxylesterase